MPAKLTRYKVNSEYVRAELKKLKVTTLVLGVLAGYSDRTEVNRQLHNGAVTQDVFDTLLKLKIVL